MGGRGSGRRPEPSIVDIDTHPRQSVCLRVAAEFLGLHVHTVRARIDEGRLAAVVDGRVCRIPVGALKAYALNREGLSGR